MEAIECCKLPGNEVEHIRVGEVRRWCKVLRGVHGSYVGDEGIGKREGERGGGPSWIGRFLCNWAGVDKHVKKFHDPTRCFC